MSSKKLFFVCSFLLLLTNLSAQQLISAAAAASASSAIGGTNAFYITDGADYPQGQLQFCQTLKTPYQWVQIQLPATFRITKVVLNGGGFGNSDGYNSNLLVTAAASDFSFSK